MSTSNSSYEDLLRLVDGLPWPLTPTDRQVTWCVGNGPIGIARSPEGRIEIFLAGPALHARSAVVRENLEHQQWFRENGEPLLANRLLLPAAGHFTQVAAFLCTEFLRNGAINDVASAFARIEPVVELAIQRLRIAGSTVLGLCGELLVLGALLDAAPASRKTDIVSGWFGFRETSRDFQIGAVGVEVKSTTRRVSSHMMEGIQQVESGHGVDGAEESGFFLASIGLEWAKQESHQNTTSLPLLVDDICEKIFAAIPQGAKPLTSQLIANIQSYGAASEIGYDHTTMKDSPSFSRRFRLSFARWYYMDDPAVLVLRSDDLLARPFVQPDSLRFRLNLPNVVSGDVNPIVGLGSAAAQILSLAW
jgi:hypothetical protein